MSLSVYHLRQTADTLEQALIHIRQTDKDNKVLYDLFRNATIKSFELALETAGKLLRKALKLYVGSPKMIDALVFNDVIRYAHKHSILNEEQTVRWLEYRANRNNTAHDYGVHFAESTLKLMPTFLDDVRALATTIESIYSGEI